MWTVGLSLPTCDLVGVFKKILLQYSCQLFTTAVDQPDKENS